MADSLLEIIRPYYNREPNHVSQNEELDRISAISTSWGPRLVDASGGGEGVMFELHEEEDS